MREMVTRDPWYHLGVRLEDAYSRVLSHIFRSLWDAEEDIENSLVHKKVGAK